LGEDGRLGGAAEVMHITDYEIGSAVLHLFRDARVFHPGGALLLEDMRRSWAATGLRARDLDQGILYLRRHLYVTLQIATRLEQTTVALLPRGSRRLTELPHSPREWLQEVCAELTLSRAARRMRAPGWLRLRSRLHHFELDQASAA
jgi:hypothetical protein